MGNQPFITGLCSNCGYVGEKHKDCPHCEGYWLERRFINFKIMEGDWGEEEIEGLSNSVTFHFAIDLYRKETYEAIKSLRGYDGRIDYIKARELFKSIYFKGWIPPMPFWAKGDVNVIEIVDNFVAAIKANGH